MANEREMLMAMRSVETGASVPYLRELAYLEGTGTQYINTGWILPDKSVTLHIKGMKLDTSTRTALCGSEGGNAKWTFVLYPQGAALCYCPLMRLYQSNYIKFNSPTEIKWTSFIQRQEEICNVTTGETIGSRASVPQTGSTPFNLFQNLDDQRSHSRIYYCKIYEELEIVRDLIPVIDMNGVPCFYNRAYDGSESHGDEFYYNAGTGTFNYGELP